MCALLYGLGIARQNLYGLDWAVQRALRNGEDDCGW